MKLHNVFLASPGDVEAERKLVKSIITETNYTLEVQSNCMLRAQLWEDDSIPDFIKTAQEAIDSQLIDNQEYLCVIVVLWHRFGTPVGSSSSGWEHELKKFKEKLESHDGFPKIGIFIKNEPLSPREIDGEQLAKVEQFIGSLSGLYKSFDCEEDFKKHVTKFLVNSVHEYRSQPSQKRLV